MIIFWSLVELKNLFGFLWLIFSWMEEHWNWFFYTLFSFVWFSMVFFSDIVLKSHLSINGNVSLLHWMQHQQSNIFHFLSSIFSTFYSRHWFWLLKNPIVSLLWHIFRSLPQKTLPLFGNSAHERWHQPYLPVELQQHINFQLSNINHAQSFPFSISFKYFTRFPFYNASNFFHTSIMKNDRMLEEDCEPGNKGDISVCNFYFYFYYKFQFSSFFNYKV